MSKTLTQNELYLDSIFKKLVKDKVLTIPTDNNVRKMLKKVPPKISQNTKDSIKKLVEQRKIYKQIEQRKKNTTFLQI